MPSFSSRQPETPPVHTINDDMTTVNPPSRFELRHRRPLAKSERMEDLRYPTTNDDQTVASATTKPKQAIQPPTNEQNPVFSPAILWMLGLALGLILLVIILALVF